MTPRILPRVAALATLALAAACASGGGRPSSDAVAKLEAERAKNPNSGAALRALGIAYYQAQRYAEARTTLAAADLATPNDGAIALYGGLTAEALGDFTAARGAYTRYLSVGTSNRTKQQIRERLAIVARNELEATAKSAVSRENELARVPGPPNTIAVPPLRFQGADTNLVPLERGVAELLITDLARSSQLTVLERERVQALLDEVARGQSNRVDEDTKLRTGKILQAGRLVQGTINQIGPDRVQIATNVVSVQTAQSGGAASADDALDQLFAMEKKIVFQIFDNLGVTLTADERKLIDDAKPTRNLRAFLAYSRGLQAEDRGDFFEASRLFNDARGMDPGFSAAGVKAAGAAAAAAGSNVSSSSIQTSTAGSKEGSAVKSAQTGSLNVTAVGAANQVANDVNASQAANSASNGQTYSGGLPGTNTSGGGGAPAANTPPAPTPPTPIPTSLGTITFVIRPPA
ncbi:MAG: tetratricopeptide repeat protein [Gemmatimonadetes bacterium]|nr:tetratricopeptide repeat protein [Gemmatimonadota bacterium]